MKQNKFVLPITIILLLCFLPLCAYGGYYRIFNAKEAGNPDHLHKINGKLYYYDENNKLIGYYTCKSAACTDAVATIDDINLEYKKGDNINTEIYENKYVFINDEGKINMYNLVSGGTVGYFKTINNYGYSTGKFIVKNENDKYGLIQMGDMISYLLPLKYEYIANVDFLNSSSYVVSLENEYFLVNEMQEELSAHFLMPFSYYDENLIVVFEDGYYKFYNYQKELLINENIISFNVIDTGFIYKTSYYVRYVDKSLIELKSFYADNYQIEGNVIKILRDGQELDSITMGG